MTEEVQASQCKSKRRLLTMDQNENGVAKTPEEGSQTLDQIIIAPEIMRIVLGKLDLRSLKQVRRVCKSWCREAQFHMEQRGIVRLYEHAFVCRSQNPYEMDKFLKVCQTKVEDLPLPFQSIDVDVKSIYEGPRLELLSSHLLNLQTPLLMTRYYPGETPLKLALPLIVQCSGSLEYLELVNTCEAGDLPALDPKLTFPKLRRLNVHMSDCRDNARMRTDYLSIVSWIVRGSPNLEEYASYAPFRMKLVRESSELLLNVNIPNVKRLTLVDYCVNTEALDHFLSLPFSKLEHLQVSIYSGPDQSWYSQALVKTIAKCATTTLRVLDLSNLPDPEQTELANFGFPICPTVKELKLRVLPNSKNFLTTHFPSLEVLSVFVVIERFENLFRKLTPFNGLKTFRTQNIDIICSEQEAEQNPVLRFFENFPTLERLSVQQKFLNKCCRLRATGKPKYTKLLDGVKHLELEHYNDFDFPSLHVFKGIETVEMTPPSYSTSFNCYPLRRFPPLKVFAFPWSVRCSDYELRQLLEMAQKVEKIVITNCCSLPRLTVPGPEKLLETFFKSTSNTVCGCRKLKKIQ